MVFKFHFTISYLIIISTGSIFVVMGTCADKRMSAFVITLFLYDPHFLKCNFQRNITFYLLHSQTLTANKEYSSYQSLRYYIFYKPNQDSTSHSQYRLPILLVVINIQLPHTEYITSFFLSFKKNHNTMKQYTHIHKHIQQMCL